MEKDSKFLPDSISGALRSLGIKIGGTSVLLTGLILSFVLIFHNPYLDGFAAASSFGNQSVLDYVVGFFRFSIGFVPALFLFLCLFRTGISMLMGWFSSVPPEYNILRGIVTVFMGAAGFGAVATEAGFGGFAGAIVANDLVRVVGNMTQIIGIILILGFLYFVGKILNIRLKDLKDLLSVIYKIIKKILSVFHLIKPAEYSEEEIDEEIEEFEEEKPKRKIKALSRNAVRKNKTQEVIEEDVPEYQLPSPEFLEQSVFSKTAITPDLKRNAIALESHFQEFGVHGRVIGIRPGPIVTLYEFEPDSGVRIAKVTDTVNDMTRAMATENIRIAHVPRTNYIGVEMVNMNRQDIRFRSLITNPLFTESKYKIPLALGVDIAGNPMYFDLAKMPHVLVAGRTGSGKSVFMQSIIMSFLYHFTPDKFKLMIIDPKAVDFTLWDGIPHLITPVLTDPNGSVNALKWSVREMEDRYQKLKEMGVQNIAGYNDAVEKLRKSGKRPTRQVAVGTDPETGELEFETREIDLSDMPYMVIMIDEVADLMSVAKKEVEACVQRLAQKARAAGIHLVAATQRPDTTVITGVIKANFPTRISFQARSSIDSGTTLGEKGAEQLLSYGDMLFSEAGRVPVRIHGSWIENSEIKKVAKFLREQGNPEYIEGIEDEQGDSTGDGAIPGMPMSKDDKNSDLYEQAKGYVLRDKKPTISYIQRRLGIGYNKAAGFMERRI